MNRSRWRMFLTVFLVIFMGGLGVTGASALWSLKTNVTATVQTGSWFSEGFQWDPQLVFTDRGLSFGRTRQLGRFTWTPPLDAGTGVKYEVTFTPTSEVKPELKSSISNPLSTASLDFETTRPLLFFDPETFRVRVRAIVGTMKSAPACYTLTLYSTIDSRGETAKISPRYNCE
jgi:hypothetical protein